MKILHVVKKYPEALGGDAVVVANLQKQQEKAGHTVVVVTSRCDEIANGKNIYKCGLKDTPATLDHITVRRMVSLVLLFFRAFFIFARERPDIIHTHSVDMAFFISFAARFFRIPVVHTFHIVTFYDASQPLLRRKTEILLAKTARAQAITAPNMHDVKKLQGAGLKRASLLPNGVDIEAWKTHGYVEKNDVFTFVTVGRLEEQKGYEYLIKAAALLKQSLATVFLVVVVGEGSQKTALIDLAKKRGVEDYFSFVGRRSPGHIKQLFAEADAAVFPSLYETTPLTLLEAWAAGVASVVTKVGILRDVPTDFNAAFVAPPMDECALAEAMKECIENTPKREATAANGHKEAQKYAWPLVARSAEALYAEAQ